MNNDFPSNDEIETLIENARTRAVDDLLEVGINVSEPGTEKFINYQCQIQPTILPTSEIHFDSDIDSEDLNDPDDMYADDDELSQDVQSSVTDVGEDESEEESERLRCIRC